MKKTILMTAMLSAFLLSCKDNKTKNSEMHQEHETENVTHHEHKLNEELLSNAWIGEMQIEDGKKWEANLETTIGVNKMVEIMEDHNPQTVEEYHAMAKALKE